MWHFRARIRTMVRVRIRTMVRARTRTLLRARARNRIRDRCRAMVAVKVLLVLVRFRVSGKVSQPQVWLRALICQCADFST